MYHAMQYIVNICVTFQEWQLLTTQSKVPALTVGALKEALYGGYRRDAVAPLPAHRGERLSYHATAAITITSATLVRLYMYVLHCRTLLLTIEEKNTQKGQMGKCMTTVERIQISRNEK